MREAPARDRAPLLEALEREQPRGGRAREAQERCAHAYRLLQEVSTLLASAETGLAPTAAGTAASAAPRSNPLTDLEQADAKEKQARQELPRCSAAVGELRRWLRP